MKLRPSINYTDGEVFLTESNLSLELTKVPISKLMSTLSPKERTEEIDDAFAQGMANSLLNSSTLLSPIIISPYKDTDNFLIIDGENRVKALQKNSVDEVLAIVVRSENGISENVARTYRIFTRRHKFDNPKAIIREVQSFLHLTDDFSISELEKIIGLKDGDYYLFDKINSNLKYSSIARDLKNGNITTQTAVELMRKKDKSIKRNQENKEKQQNSVAKNAKSRFLDNELSGKGTPKAFGGNMRKDILLKKVLERDNHQCFTCGTSDREELIDLYMIVPEDAKGRFAINNVVPLCIECKAKVEGYSLNTDLERMYSADVTDALDDVMRNILMLANIATEYRLNNLRALEKENEVLFSQVKNGSKPYLNAVKKIKESDLKEILPKNVKPYNYVCDKRV